MEKRCAQIPDMDLFKERLGIQGMEIKNDLETLDLLIHAYQTHIPYENLQVCIEKTIPSLAVEDLFDKLIVRKRGGYCLEMNGLCEPFLKDLGFDVYSAGAFVSEYLDFRPNLSHRAMVAVFEGEKYYFDVGFGGASQAPSAIPFTGIIKDGFFLRQNEENTYFMDLFKLVDPEEERAKGKEAFTLKMNVDGEEVYCKKILMFRDVPSYPQEFVLPNKALFYTPEHFMLSSPVCIFHNEKDENYVIQNNKFRWHNAEGKGEREIEGEEDLLALAEKYFGIVL